MLKKILICVIALMVMLISVVSALEIGDEFYLFGRDDEKLAKALSMTETEIANYCKQNFITELAVNKDNTKQIREITRETEFSKMVKNLAVLSDEEIADLTFQLCGFENIKGKVIEKGVYKYLKIEVKSKDSGGEYILTQYITVKNSKIVTLSFYTSNGKDTSYADKIFNSQFESTGGLKVVITILLALLFGVAATLSVMIVRDLNKPKEELENNT
ncbi:MAG: hypothetical protein IKV81_06765 [Clostridia bacterium]|nr:hypothetical protein [Clostridia bacterium]